MTEQEILNKAWNYHVVQGRALGYSEEIENCSYVAGCAIGCQLPEDVLVRIKENGHDAEDVEGLITHYDVVRSMFKGVQLQFLFDLQLGHDNAATGCVATLVNRDPDEAEDEGVDATYIAYALASDQTSQELIRTNYAAVANKHGLVVPNA